jgi:two-component system OmpR family sensor kinase
VSLRTRLLVSVGLVALVALALAGVFTYTATRGYVHRQLEQTLRVDSAALSATFTPSTPDSSRLAGAVAPGAFVELRDSSGRSLVTVAAVRPGGQRVRCDLPAALPAVGRSSSSAVFFSTPASGGSGTGFRVLASHLADGDELVVGLPLSGSDSVLHHLLIVELGVAGAALLAAVLLGWWLVRASLRPLRNIERTAGLIAAGDVNQRVAVNNPHSEVGQLAGAFNFMVDRIQAAFAARDRNEAELRRSEARLRRFVADASHELRTPLSAVSAYAELSRVPELRPEDLSRAMAGISAETDRMRCLIDELLLLARLDQGRPLDTEPVELVGLTAQAVGAARAVGPDWPVALEAFAPVEVVGDPARLRQVLENLLANVRAHTPPGTRTRVVLGEEAEWAVVEVTDSGPGLSPEQTTLVFERFYRAEASRSRRHGGGSGLGLAITKAIVEAHLGTVTASNAPGGGAVFTVRLPRSPSAVLELTTSR